MLFREDQECIAIRVWSFGIKISGKSLLDIEAGNQGLRGRRPSTGNGAVKSHPNLATKISNQNLTSKSILPDEVRTIIRSRVEILYVH